MTKKKIVSLCLAAVLVVMAIAGATVAYFTDTKTETNTFTLGNVKIALNEQQKGDNGLEAFEQNKVLVPGKSNDGNAVSKIVTVTNTGDNDAWVWVDLQDSCLPCEQRIPPPMRARTPCIGTAMAAST